MHRFFQTVENGYHTGNKYHNSLHAADVMQTMHHFLLQSFFQKTMKLSTEVSSAQQLKDMFETAKETFAGLVACMVHDLRHPGITNKFLIRTQDVLAMRYNDRGVLENWHVATAFEWALANDQINIFKNMSESRYRTIRAFMISNVLATDLAQHLEYINQLRLKSTNTVQHDWKKDDVRRLMTDLAIKSSDISNPGKPFPVYIEWTTRIMEEFWVQV